MTPSVAFQNLSQENGQPVADLQRRTIEASDILCPDPRSHTWPASRSGLEYTPQAKGPAISKDQHFSFGVVSKGTREPMAKLQHLLSWSVLVCHTFHIYDDLLQCVQRQFIFVHEVT